MTSAAIDALPDGHTAAERRPVRWHIAIFLAPALLVYTAVMVVPLVETATFCLYALLAAVPADVSGLPP